MEDFSCRSFCIAKVTFDMCRFPSGVWSGCGVGIRRRVWPVPSPGEWQPCPSPSVCLRKWTWVSDRKLDTASDLRTARPPKLSSSKKISACWVMCKILKSKEIGKRVDIIFKTHLQIPFLRRRACSTVF